MQHLENHSAMSYSKVRKDEASSDRLLPQTTNNKSINLASFAMSGRRLIDATHTQCLVRTMHCQANIMSDVIGFNPLLNTYTAQYHCGYHLSTKKRFGTNKQLRKRKQSFKIPVPSTMSSWVCPALCTSRCITSAASGSTPKWHSGPEPT